MKLPDNEMFDGFDLTIDQSEDIKEVETKLVPIASTNLRQF